MTERHDTGQARILMRPGDIFSKWGFEDGDLLDGVLAAHAQHIGLDPDAEDWHYLSSHRLLWHAYHRFVAQPDWEPVMYVSTVHNPVRALCDWHGTERAAASPEEDAAPVAVTQRAVRELCQELFPPRPLWWLELHNALADRWEWRRPEHPLLGPPESPYGPAVSMADVTDRVVARFELTADECRLAAVLLSGEDRGWAPRDDSEEDPEALLTSTVATVRSALT